MFSRGSRGAPRRLSQRPASELPCHAVQVYWSGRRLFVIPLPIESIRKSIVRPSRTDAVLTVALDPDTERAARMFVQRIAGQYDMAGAILFGSRARGTHRPDSDADVAVLLRGEHRRFLPTKLAMADVAFDVLLETGIRIQPLPVWEDEWEHPESYSNPRLLANIASEGVRL